MHMSRAADVSGGEQGRITPGVVVESVEVVEITPVGDKDIGNQFQDRGLPGTSLSHEKDGVWCFRLIRRTLDDPLLERLCVTGKQGQKWCIKYVVGTHLVVRILSPTRESTNSSFGGVLLRGPAKLMEDWLVELPLLEKPTRVSSCSQFKVWPKDSRARHDLSSGRNC